MKLFLPVLFVTLGLAGCATSPPVTVVTTDAGPFIRDAALIEQRLERQNRSDYDCGVQPDTLIVCDGVHHRLR
ncbi:MAG TPA: hypothetical protein VKN63_00805 [Afifellaceae bacterium]|nr:hypothetical protein [Afifellaceae bacterium]